MSRELKGVYQWQYNGAAQWQEIYIWCRDNLNHYWSNGSDTFHFDDEKEYAWFLLRWS